MVNERNSTPRSWGDAFARRGIEGHVRFETPHAPHQKRNKGAEQHDDSKHPFQLLAHRVLCGDHLAHRPRSRLARKRLQITAGFG